MGYLLRVLGKLSRNNYFSVDDDDGFTVCVGFRWQWEELSWYRTLHSKSARNPQEKHTKQEHR